MGGSVLESAEANFVVRVVVLEQNGTVVLLNQMIQRSSNGGDALASFLVPLKSTVVYASVKGVDLDTQF
jgi:hypothetical protein